MDNMRISSILQTYGSYGTEQALKSAKIGQTKASKDTVALSSTAKDYQTAKKAMSGIPDIREDKVALIKAQMEKGTYSVDSSDLADKMIRKLSLSL